MFYDSITALQGMSHRKQTSALRLNRTNPAARDLYDLSSTGEWRDVTRNFMVWRRATLFRAQRYADWYISPQFRMTATLLAEALVEDADTHICTGWHGPVGEEKTTVDWFQKRSSSSFSTYRSTEAMMLGTDNEYISCTELEAK